MTESNSQPVRCPCGFFGSSQTRGLCSKCFIEHEQKRNERTGLPQHSADASNSAAASTPAFQDNSTNTPPVGEDDKRDVEAESRVTPQDDDSPPDDSSPANQHRGVKRKHDEVEDETEVKSQEESPPARKTRCRCFLCQCRLPPALTVIGKCKCDNLYCPSHRLPEQHGCTFDHKESGRAEARAKMVPYRKQVGTSLKRLDQQ